MRDISYPLSRPPLRVSRHTSVFTLAAGVLAVLCGLGITRAQQRSSNTDWPVYGGNAEGTRFYQLMEEARYSLDPAKRVKNYHEAAQIYHDEAVELFLFQGELIDGARKELVYKARGDQRIIVYDISFR